MLTADPFPMRLMGIGLFKPKNTILGTDIAGCVEAVGRNVKQCRPGDAVFGDIFGLGSGSFAEYVSIPESALALKPSNVSFDCVHPCPCGYFGDSIKPCTCAPSMVTKYQKRISGPMLDRMDIHIEVPRVDYEKLSSDRLGESSADIRARVESARARQRVRFAEAVNVVSNSDMRVAEVRQFCKLDETSESLVRAAMSQLQLSARAYHRILKLSRTIADLAGSDAIQSVHLAEALQYRPKIMMG